MISSLAELIRGHGRELGARPAVTADGRTATFAELDQRSNQVAQALLAEGLGVGDRVAILDSNSIEHFEVLFGGAKLGAVNVALNWRLSRTELVEVLNDSDAMVLVVGAAFASLVADVEADLLHVRKVVAIGGHAAYESYEDWLAAQRGEDPGTMAEPERVVIQIYTSGTTGSPKGVMLSERNVLSLIRQGGPALALEADSVNLVAMPLFHIGGSGYALIGCYAGCHTVLLRQVDPAAILRVMVERKVTNTFVVPAVLLFLLGIPGIGELDLTALRTISYGASPISVDMLTRAIATFGCDFVQVYGLTETTGTITLLDAEDHRSALKGDGDRLRSAGRPVAGAEVRVVSTASGAVVGAGEVGEVEVRSPQVTVGYYRKPEETASALDPDGWLRTGDAGMVDAEGYLFLSDRIKDMIITGGENVYPVQVENVLMSHPDVADVAVIGVPDDRWGETVVAVVVPSPASDPDPQAIIAYAREQLAHYKCPSTVHFAEVLPRNPSGKLLKRVLRAEHAGGMWTSS